MKKHILLSVKPTHVDQIRAGIKRYEFRKSFPDTSEDDISSRVIIYSADPNQEIVGSFQISKHLRGDFESLMIDIEASRPYRQRISKYFTDKKNCHVIEISRLNMYENPLSLEYLQATYPGFTPGVNYSYIDPQILNDIKNKNGSF